MYKPKEAWYQLSEDERNALAAKSMESLERVGGKTVVSCFSGWSSEEWMLFGVEEYPDIEAVQKNQEEQIAFDWFRYLESKSMLGTKWEP